MAADPRFHPIAGPQSLRAILAAVRGEAAGDPDRLFQGPAALDQAGPDELTFIDSPKLAPALASTRAGAVLLRAEMAARAPAGAILIAVANPQLAFARAAALFHPPRLPAATRHPTAVIAPDADVADDAIIGPYAVIGAGAVVGAGCTIGPHAVVGDGVVLGPRCVIHAHACISHALCGEGVVLHPGARVGQEGFGFLADEAGRFVTKPQLGRVILGDFAQVGANACIDRGTLDDTVIGAQTRIDNLVQIGHNTRTGMGCILAGQAGLSGSVTLEDRVVLGGQVGVADHVRLGRGARIAAQSGIMVDVAPGVEMFGTPAQPIRMAMREISTLRRLAATPRAKQDNKE